MGLSIDLQPGATPAAASLALEWAWPHGRKQLRSRTAAATPLAAATPSAAASGQHADDAVAAAEAWFPSHEAGAVGAGAVGAGAAEAGAMVLLDDGVEVSPAFYLLLKRFLLVTQVRLAPQGTGSRAQGRRPKAASTLPPFPA